MFVRLNYDKEIKLIFRRMSFDHKFEDGFALFFNLGCHRWKTVAARVEAPSYVQESGEECCVVIKNFGELMSWAFMLSRMLGILGLL